jgi:hypothetical protein
MMYGLPKLDMSPGAINSIRFTDSDTLRYDGLVPLRTVLELWDREEDFFPVDWRPNESMSEDYYV